LITGSCDLDTVEEVFDVVLKLDLTFKTIVNAKARCSKCEGYEHHDFQCPSESQHIRTVPIDDVDDSKVVEDVQVPPKTVSIIEDIAVCFDILIIDETHMSSDSASNDVNVKFEPNTTTVSSKPVESPRAEYNLMIVPTDSSFRESLEFLTKIQQMISSTSLFFDCLEFVSESNVPPSARLECVLLDMSYLSFSHR